MNPKKTCIKQLRYITLVFLFCFTSSLKALDSNDLYSFIDNLDKVNLEVFEHKYVDLLDKTFSTYSLVKFEKNKGFIWKHNQDRFVSTLTQYCYNSEEPKNFEDLSHYSDVKKLTDALLKKDLSGLQKIFDIKYSKYITFIPIRSSVKKWIKSIKIKLNSKKIDWIELIYQNNNKIILQFRTSSKVIKDEIHC